MPDRLWSGINTCFQMPRKLQSLLYYYRIPTLTIVFCLSLVCIRILITKSLFFSFLLWNLFLAIVPYFISQFMILQGVKRLSLKYKVPLLVVWLLFLPNAPYLITDLIHLHNFYSNWTWFDLFTVFSFAITGVLFGTLSLLDFYSILNHIHSKKLANLIIPVVCFLSGYGIYLGRFLRFNSWDVIYKPQILLNDMVTSLTKPYVWLMSFAFGTLMTLFFFFVKWIKEEI